MFPLLPMSCNVASSDSDVSLSSNLSAAGKCLCVALTKALSIPPTVSFTNLPFIPQDLYPLIPDFRNLLFLTKKITYNLI